LHGFWKGSGVLQVGGGWAVQLARRGVWAAKHRVIVLSLQPIDMFLKFDPDISLLRVTNDS
jgi:hypothetical protein